MNSLKVFPALMVRMDSLLVQCVKASAKYYIPQDAAFLTFFFAAKYLKSNHWNAPVKNKDSEKALKQFMKKKGLEESQVSISSTSSSVKLTIS